VTEAQIQAVEAYIKAYRTAEHSAVDWLGRFVSADVVVEANGMEVKGRQAVLDRLAGVRPALAALVSVGFSTPVTDEEGAVTVVGALPPLGAAPSTIEFRFFFDAADKVTRVVETLTPRPDTGQTGTALPLYVRGCINGALANGTPITFGYIDLENRPQLSLRGSVHVLGDLQLGMWLRPTDHSAKALGQNPQVALIYRDSKTRTTLTLHGRAHLEPGSTARERIFNLIPEVEQTHDPDRRGHAVVVDLESVDGTSPLGPVKVRRA
jgi:hypothetical protein